MPRFSLSPAASVQDEDEEDYDGYDITNDDYQQGYDGGDYGDLNRQTRHHQIQQLQRRRLRLDDDDDSSNDDSSERDDSEESEDDDDEEEEPHPLGFPGPSYGKTRFCLIDDDDDDLDWWARGGSSNAVITAPTPMIPPPREQYYPPIHSSHTYLSSNTANTPFLLRHYNKSVINRREEEEDAKMEEELIHGMDRIARLVRAACQLDEEEVKRCCDVSLANDASVLTPQEQLQQYRQGHQHRQQRQNPLWQLAAAAEKHELEAKKKMERNRKKMEQDRMRASDTLRKLIARDEASARVILTRERKEKEARDAAELKRIADQKKKEEQQKQKEEAILKQKEEELRIKNANIAAEQALEEERRRKKEEEHRKKTEYVTKAKKLCDQLVKLRSTLEPFEKLKTVSRRRLNMKKVVRGKLNTLSHDAAKICSVVQDIATAINEAKDEDASIKEQIKAAGGAPVEGLSSEMARGKRYLIDLLASNVIVRVQAESFNGTRGDGFPLAAMLAKLSIDAKEFVPTFTAHVYTACPMSIPTLPGGESVSGGSEDDLMESLGMQKDKNGEYETFDRFLGRTEGLVSLIADIMSSTPGNHSLLGGHEGAVVYLERFLGLLPPAPTPLPLLTAPVLVAFLTGAGHMLANKFPEKFKPILDTITKDIMLRLDEGTMGVPSATRLRKVTEDGFDGFKNKLPPGAIPELYDGGEGSGSGVPTPSAVPPSVSGLLAAPGVGGQPMSAGEGSNSFLAQNTPTDPFGATSAQQQPPQNNPFGGVQQGTGTTSTPFGQPQNNAMADSTDGASPFGSQQTQSTPFGGPTSTQPQGLGPSNPFGGNAGVNKDPSPFGGGTAAGPFNATLPGDGAGGAFGRPSNPPGAISNPFGGTGGTTITQPSPFGGGSTGGNNKDNRPPCKFFAEGTCRNGANCKFSHGSTNAQPNNAFNTGMQQPGPFGGGSAGNNNKDGRPPCKFFAEGKCRNGANCKFSHATPGGGDSNNAQPGAFGNTPFGGGGNKPQPSPFGGAGGGAQTTPFGGSGATTQNTSFGGGGATTLNTPFGGGGATTQNTPFGGVGATTQNTPFGGGGNSVQTTPFGGNTSQKSPFGGGNPMQGFGNVGAGAGGGGFGAFGGGGGGMPAITNPFGAPQR